MTTIKTKQLRRKQRRRRKVVLLREKLVKTSNPVERQRLVQKIKKVSPRAPIP